MVTTGVGQKPSAGKKMFTSCAKAGIQDGEEA